MRKKWRFETAEHTANWEYIFLSSLDPPLCFTKMHARVTALYKS